VSISCAALLLPTCQQNRGLSGMGQFWTPITAKGGSLLHAVLHMNGEKIGAPFFRGAERSPFKI
jgi:hypothetical protein